MTGLLAAAVDGIHARYDLQPMTPGAVADWTDEDARAHGITRLPANLGEALDALAADEVLRAALGPAINDHYMTVKRAEARIFDREVAASASPDVLTDWEIETYIPAL